VDRDKRHKYEEERGRKGGHADAVDGVFGRVDMPELRCSVTSGAWAGLIGGVMMAAALAISYNSDVSSAFLPLQVLTFDVTGNVELSGSISGTVGTLALMLMGAVALGALFGLIVAKYVGKLSTLGSAGVGMTYGLLVWIVSQFVVLGFLAPDAIVLYDQNALALSHALYGICLGLFGRAYHRNRPSRCPHRTILP